MQSDLHQGETERRTFLLAPSVLSLGIQPLECVCIHLKNASLLPLCGTCELVNVSPFVLQRQVFWLPIPQVEALKIGSTICGVQTVKEKPETPGMGFMARVCFSLSYRFPCGYFLIYLVCRSHSASFCIFLRRNFSVYRCTFSVCI